MVNTLGSMIIAIASLVLSQISVSVLWCCKSNRYLRKLYNFAKIDGPIKPILIIFMLEDYIDLLLGALINTENDFLFLVADNWGPYGNLNYSDQFTVLLGTFFYFSCIIFPVVVFWALHKKSRGYVYLLKGDQAIFNETYECLYDGFVVQKSGLFHYYSVYMIRRIVFVAICFIFWEEQFTLLQIMSNITIALVFVLYLIHFRPFFEPVVNTLQIINETAYLMLSMHQLCFTDFASGPEVKNIAGWSMVSFAVLNLLFPNLYLVLVSMYPDIRDLLRCKKDKELPLQRGNIDEEEYIEYMEQRRRLLITKYRLKLKAEFEDEEQEPEYIKPRRN